MLLISCVMKIYLEKINEFSPFFCSYLVMTIKLNLNNKQPQNYYIPIVLYFTIHLLQVIFTIWTESYILRIIF